MDFSASGNHRLSEGDSREYLLSMLDRYGELVASDYYGHAGFQRAEEFANLRTIQAFVQNYKTCFSRDALPGHITGSAIITNPAMDRVLLTHHRKLNLWLQLGGHSDDDSRTDQVALREAQEESGLSALQLWPGPGSNLTPFDLDAHQIPARSGSPAHIHYDVRFLIIADAEAPVTVSEESHDVRWFSLPQAYQITAERSMHRQFEKLIWVRQQLGA